MMKINVNGAIKKPNAPNNLNPINKDINKNNGFNLMLVETIFGSTNCRITNVIAYKTMKPIDKNPSPVKKL